MQGNDFVCPKCGIGRFSGTEDGNAPIGLLGPVLKYQPEGKEYWVAMDGTNWVYALGLILGTHHAGDITDRIKQK